MERGKCTKCSKYKWLKPQSVYQPSIYNFGKKNNPFVWLCGHCFDDLAMLLPCHPINDTEYHNMVVEFLGDQYIPPDK